MSLDNEQTLKTLGLPPPGTIFLLKEQKAEVNTRALGGTCGGWLSTLLSARPAGLVAVVVICLGGLMVSACGDKASKLYRDYQETDAGLTRQDFRKGFVPEPVVPEAEPAAPAIPQLKPIVGVDKLELPASARLVSLEVNETVSVKDMLYELARNAKVDLQLDPKISGSLILTANQRRFEDVVDRIANLVGLRYTISNNILSIERDTPYHINYRVDFLSIKRSATGAISTSTGGTGGGGGGGGGGGSQGAGQTGLENTSQSEVTNTSETDFWAELEVNLQQILANTAAPTAAEEGLTTYFSANKLAGVVSVFATQHQHKIIEAYLKKLGAAVLAQVLIEAKVLEVSLKEEFETGINWFSAFNGPLNFALPMGGQVTAPPFATQASATPGVLTLARSGNVSLNFIANLVERFGTVRALSSPRLVVMQNQTAVLQVTENRVFFKLDFQRQAGTPTSAEVTTVSSTVNTVPVGLIMTVQPSINLKTDEITLNIRPLVTRIIGLVNDPAVAIQSNNTVQSAVPEVSIQEMDSMVTMRSREIVVMGGLMQDDVSSQESGVPGISRIPWLGRAFKSKTETSRKTELVILLRATILRSSTPKFDSVDADLFGQFSRDRRSMFPDRTQ